MIRLEGDSKILSRANLHQLV